MPKNKGKGGKNRRRGKNENESTKRELNLKEDDQEYALVLSLLGNVKLDLKCFDGTRRIGLIRGKLRKKVWISVNDVVLVSLRPFQDNFCDVIAKYNADEVRQLKNIGHITDVTEEQKNEVIKFSMEGKVAMDSDDEDILANITGMRNLNRPTQEMLDGMGFDTSDEDDSDDGSEEEDSDEEEESEEESEEEEEDPKKKKTVNYKQDSNQNKTRQQIEMENILAGLEISGGKTEKDYSVNKVKTKTSTFSDMVDKNEDEEEEEEPAQLSNADLMNKLNMFQNSIKDLRINKKNRK